MWRQLTRTIVSAFSMFTRNYSAWLRFGIVFSLFFHLLGIAAGSLVLLSLGYFFHPKYFSASDPTDIAHIWWVAHCLTAMGYIFSLSIGLFAAYMKDHRKPVSFGHFLRFVPGRTWSMFSALSLLFVLITYFNIFCAIKVDAGGSEDWHYVSRILDWLTPLLAFMFAAVIYMNAAGITNYPRYWRNIATYQITDFVISFSLSFVLSLLVYAFAPSAAGGGSSWELWLYNMLGFIVVNFVTLFTISFYSCLLFSSFPQQPEEIVFEMETSRETRIIN